MIITAVLQCCSQQKMKLLCSILCINVIIELATQATHDIQAYPPLKYKVSVFKFFLLCCLHCPMPLDGHNVRRTLDTESSHFAVSALHEILIYTTKIDGVVCPPNISETVADRLMKLAHRQRIASTTIQHI